LRADRRERYIFYMWERSLFALLIAAGVLLAGLWLVPVGCGPYTVVYGPTTALRAQRAMLFLTLVWVALAALGPAAVVIRRILAFRPLRCAACGAERFILSPELSGLRC